MVMAAALGLGWGLAGTAAAQTLTERALAAAPEAAVPAAAPLTIWGSGGSADPVGPGDLLQVEVFGQPQLSSSLRVGPNGEIAPPFLPAETVGGETALAIQAHLTAAYGALLRHPLVSVRLVENNSRKVSIDGAVPRPGVYAFSGQLTLLEALGMAGGLDPSRASSEVLLFHQPPVSARRDARGTMVYTANSVLETINLDRIAQDPALNRRLQPGDVIDVQPVRQVYISGDVLHPGSATLTPGLTLGQLISYSGGLLPQANPGQVRLLRLQPDGTRRTLTADVGAIQKNRRADVPLAADDIVLVPGSVMRMAGLELLDFFTGTGRWRVQQSVANHIP